MRLDYNPERKLFVLFVKRDEGSATDIMREYGLTFYVGASSANEMVFSTPEPYAAAAFGHCATPLASAELGWIFAQVEASRAPTSGSHYDVPQTLLDQGTDLWAYQRADLDYMLARDYALDADEPGLGKTPTAIVYANEIRARRVLVICPASIRFQWCRKWLEWSSMERYLSAGGSRLVYAITAAKLGVHDEAAVTVASYEMARHPGIHAALMKGTYDVCILDEAHYLKSGGAQRTRAIFGSDRLGLPGLVSRCRRVVALTGTPLPNRPREAYTLARHLEWSSIDWMSEDRFGERFNPIEQMEIFKKDGTRVIVNHEECGRHAELQNRLRANFMTRHLKRDVMTQLKLPKYDLVVAEETGPVRQALKAEKLLDIDPDTLTGEGGEILGHIAEARRLMGEALAPQAATYARMLLDGGVEKLVLFYWHISVGHILQRALLPYGVVRVDGGTSPVVKDALVQKFITHIPTRVIMGNILSLGTGTDGLQQVSGHVLICEPDWTPGNNVQMVDRLDRGGQTRTVMADIMVAPNSIAERVLASALRKGRVTFNTLDRRVA